VALVREQTIPTFIYTWHFVSRWNTAGLCVVVIDISTFVPP